MSPPLTDETIKTKNGNSNDAYSQSRSGLDRGLSTQGKYPTVELIVVLALVAAFWWFVTKGTTGRHNPQRARTAANASPPVAAMPNSQLIPKHLLESLPAVGRTAFGGEYIDVSEFYLPAFLAAGTPTADAEWARFVDQWSRELLSASKSLGGWAQAGAFHVANDFVKSGDWQRQQLVEIMDNALQFLALNHPNPDPHIPFFAQDRWFQIRGRQ